MELQPFSTAGLAGWVRAGDDDRQVLLLHGGPSIPHDYLRPLVETLPGWSCASYQQRGSFPSSTRGPFDVPTAVADVAHVLEHLAAQGWERPLVAGHSWGGHLAWHVAAVLGDRVSGVLAVDPLGAVGDMGLPAFGEEIERRLDPGSRERFTELEARWESVGLTEAEHVEHTALILPSYFAEPSRARGQGLETALVVDVFERLVASALALQPLLAAALPAVGVPVGAVHGAASPMPVTASTDATDLVPGAWTEVVEDCGHFVWLEAPGAVLAALERLRSESPPRS